MNGLRPLARGSGELLAALVLAAVVGALTLALVNAPSFAEPSWLPESFGTVLTVGFVILAAWGLLRRTTGARGVWLLGTAGPAFLAASHLGLLLHGTPHYLFGLGGDQLNRVAYVTRFADSAELADPFYADAAPFYPPQWFWVGGRLAALIGADGWEFYKPYSILTMAVTGAVAFVAWRWLLPARLAALFGLATAVVGVHTNAYEPYSWILICLLPQIVVATFLLCGRLTSSTPATWPLVVTIGAYLGTAALGYTLIAGFAALVVGMVMLLHAWLHRSEPAAVHALLGRLAAIAGISAAIALLFWHRYLFAVLGGARTEPSVANDFAPESGAELPLPMFEMSVTGVLCLIGVVWVVMTVWPTAADPHAHSSDIRTAAWPLPAPERALVLARSVALTVAAVYGWYLLSGLRALTGSTLLPFRMIPVLTLVLALAGIMGALELVRWILARAPAASRGKAAAAAVVVTAFAAVQMVQHVSEEDAEFAATARKTAGEPTELLATIDGMTAEREPSDLVLLTSDPTLYSYRPFFTFQAPAQAYATPAGRYEERTAEIRRWSDSSSAADLVSALDSSAFRAPDVMVLDREAPGRWVFPATINEMPLQHNNSREEIVFGPHQFSDSSLFDVREVGSHVVVVRR